MIMWICDIKSQEVLDYLRRVFIICRRHIFNRYSYILKIFVASKRHCALCIAFDPTMPVFSRQSALPVCHISFTRARNLPVQKPARFLKNLFATKCRKIFNFFFNFRYNIIQSIKHGNVYRAKFIHCKTKCKLKFFRKNIKLQILYILRILCTLFISRNIVKL